MLHMFSISKNNEITEWTCKPSYPMEACASDVMFEHPSIE